MNRAEKEHVVSETLKTWFGSFVCPEKGRAYYKFVAKKIINGIGDEIERTPCPTCGEYNCYYDNKANLLTME